MGDDFKSFIGNYDAMVMRDVGGKEVESGSKLKQFWCIFFQGNNIPTVMLK